MIPSKTGAPTANGPTLGDKNNFQFMTQTPVVSVLLYGALHALFEVLGNPRYDFIAS